MRFWILKFWILIACALALSSVAQAQKIKVRKTKGNTAIVEFSGETPRTGAVYELAPSDESDETGDRRRAYVVGLNFALTSTKSDIANSSNQTNIALTSRFGWNLHTVEVGPLIGYSQTQLGDVTSSIYKVGMFIDYNFIPNISGEAFIYGLGATGAFGQADNGLGTKSSVGDAFAGPFIKWFPTASSAGLRVDLGYSYQKQTAENGNVTISGIAAAAGIFAYF